MAEAIETSTRVQTVNGAHRRAARSPSQVAAAHAMIVLLDASGIDDPGPMEQAWRPVPDVAQAQTEA